MKTVAAVLAVAAVTATAGYSAGQGVTPGQISALNKRVTKLEKIDSALLAFVGTCLADYAPITSYGVPNENEGYLYQRSSGEQIRVSALAITEEGDTPSAFIPVSKEDCTLKSARIRRTLQSARR